MILKLNQECGAELLVFSFSELWCQKCWLVLFFVVLLFSFFWCVFSCCALVRLVSFGLSFQFVGFFENFSELVKTFRSFSNFGIVRKQNLSKSCEQE